MSNISDNSSETNLKIFTLNCWGLKFVSKLRKERFKAISEYLSQNGSGYDVVFLQEVWCREDYETLRAKLCNSKELYPYSHFFSNGVIGSGTCILSKFRLLQASYHEFSMNGYPTAFWHGDWFASKGIGVCQIRFGSKNLEEKSAKSSMFDVHLYISHYHANYDPNDDRYLGHRVLHAFESAQWVNLTSSSADLIIYAGDFNTEPESLPYRILCCLGSLKDTWQQYTENICDGDVRKTRNGCCTSESLINSFTPIPTSSTCRGNSSSSEAILQIEGKRIDYIMYRVGRNIEVDILSCSLPLPDRVPNENYSFSDHEAVDAVFKLKRVKCNVDDLTKDHTEQQTDMHSNGVQVGKAVENQSNTECVKIVEEAIEVMENTLEHVARSKTKYVAYAVLCLILFVSTFITCGFPYLSTIERIGLDLGLFIPRLLLVTGIVVFSLMGSLFNKRERHSIKEVTNELSLMVVQDD